MAKIIFLKPGQKSMKKVSKFKKRAIKCVLYMSLLSNMALIYYILTNINVG